MMMEKILMQPKQVRFGKVVKFILPTYLTSLFNTLYTIVDGIFVSACVGTNALAAINIVYPIVNILTGIALAFATGGGAFAAISLGAGQKEKAGRQFSVCLVMTLLVSGLAAGGVALCLPQLLTFFRGHTSDNGRLPRLYNDLADRRPRCSGERTVYLFYPRRWLAGIWFSGDGYRKNCQYFAGLCAGSQVEHGRVGSWSGHYFGIGPFLWLGDLVFLPSAAAAAARMTWRLSDGVLVIGGTGEAIMPYAESRVDSPGTLFKRNPYIETAIIQEGITSTRCLFKFMPNLKNIIVMSNETDVNGIAYDCPRMNTIIVGADLKDSSLAMGYNEFDGINKTTNNYTGGGLAISYPDPVDNMVVLSSSCGDFQKQFSEAKTLIADMNLPQFALDLLPANLGGGSASEELPEQAPVTVSPWAESIVDEAEAQKLFPYRIYDVYGRDFRSLFPANH